MLRILLFVGFILLWVLMPVFSRANAVDNVSLGIANYIPIQGSNIKNGDIISFSNKGYFLSSKPYDPFIIGVVITNPAVSLSLVNGGKNNYPVATSGNIEVNVNSSNGNIRSGDLITTSSIPGVGMRATKTGYVIGSATSSYSSKNPKEVGKVNISLNLHYAYLASPVLSNLKDIFNLSILATYETPSAVFKYFVAGIVIILAALFGFLSFGRTANKGIEALGRNPLAGKMIELGIVLNVLIALGILGTGLIVAIVIIRL